jgi:hypothetical protein
MFFYFESDCVIIGNSIYANPGRKTQDTDSDKERSEGYCSGRKLDRDERATSRRRRGDMRNLLDRRT